MKIKIFQKVIEEFEVEVKDGLTGDELQSAVENAKEQYGLTPAFIEIETWNWEPIV